MVVGFMVMGGADLPLLAMQAPRVQRAYWERQCERLLPQAID